ncbi:MAG TPA: Beta-galactosidase C-terminal domain, partial [Caldilineaceae bacterium]|nr:Beta-galactosidase C-terminal domain [Caldilineaceae bacterium]
PATPAGVEVCTRWQGNQPLVFVLNHTAEEQTVVLPGGYMPLLGGQQPPAGTAHGTTETAKTAQFTLPPREVIVLLGEEAYNPSAHISVAHA